MRALAGGRPPQIAEGRQRFPTLIKMAHFSVGLP